MQYLFQATTDHHFRLLITNVLEKSILDQFTDYLITDKNKLRKYQQFHAVRVLDINLGAPDVVEIDQLPDETTDDTITLKWKEPESNGKVITMYTVYQRVVTDGKVGQWTEIKKIRDVSVRELKIALERGKVYQFAITATNELGESLKQEKANIQQVKAEGSMFK